MNFNHLMKSTFFVRTALSNEEMYVRMKIDTFPEGLDESDDPNGELLKSQNPRFPGDQLTEGRT